MGEYWAIGPFGLSSPTIVRPDPLKPSEIQPESGEMTLSKVGSRCFFLLLSRRAISS